MTTASAPVVPPAAAQTAPGATQAAPAATSVTAAPGAPPAAAQGVTGSAYAAAPGAADDDYDSEPDKKLPARRLVSYPDSSDDDSSAKPPAVVDSTGDPGAFKNLSTPEMVAYFCDQASMFLRREVLEIYPLSAFEIVLKVSGYQSFQGPLICIPLNDASENEWSLLVMLIYENEAELCHITSTSRTHDDLIAKVRHIQSALGSNVHSKRERVVRHVESRVCVVNDVMSVVQLLAEEDSTLGNIMETIRNCNSTVERNYENLKDEYNEAEDRQANWVLVDNTYMWPCRRLRTELAKRVFPIENAASDDVPIAFFGSTIGDPLCEWVPGSSLQQLSTMSLQYAMNLYQYGNLQIQDACNDAVAYERGG